MIEQLIAEATECDFKVALETKKPKSWLKSVSAFSNGIGGTLFFGVSDDREPIGLSDVQKDAEAISRLIKERITPLPQFILKPLQEDGKNLLALEVSPGRSTPYYYKADGVMEAYIRVGNESVIAPDYIVNELILKGTNQSFDTLTTEAVKKDYSFTLLEATYLERTGLRFEPSDYVSFGLADKNGAAVSAYGGDASSSGGYRKASGTGSITFNRGSDSNWSNVGGFAGNSSDSITMSAQHASTYLGNDSYVDLDTSSIFTINSLRTAFQMQKFYERLARGGSRYTEVLRSFFGVVSPDARLQRPEFLGSFTKMINVNPIAQTSATDDTSPQGNLSAYGVTAAKFHGFTKSFVEHGYVFGFVCARADLTYQQGINKMWLRSTVYDFYWPTFAHLGEQAIELREIYAQGSEADTTVFGYQERYAEYRYKPSQITGKFRSSVTGGNLDVWHLSQFFKNAPTLNEEFITENPPIERIIAVPSEPEFLLDVGFRYTTVRPMPMFGTPGLVDHF